MASLPNEFLDLIERNVRFECSSCGSTWVTFPHSTGWRVIPSVVVSQINLEALLEQPGQAAVPVRPGQALCLAPGKMHRITMTSRRAAYSHWSHFQCEILQGVSLFYLVQPPLVIAGRRSMKIGEINRNLARISEGMPSVASMLRRQALGWQLIVTLLEKVPLTDDRIDLVRSASRLTPVLSYIEAHLAEPITHDLLARTAGLSPSRFHVVFRAALGTAPYEYLQKLRLKKAQQLLTQTECSVAEIGEQVGHPDPYHFSRVFRRSMGVSPRSYRQQASRRSL